MIASPRKLRIFTDRDVQLARAFLDKDGGADWTAIRRRTITSDDEARRITVRMMGKLYAAGLAADRTEATSLMFEIIRRLKRDIALAQHIKALLAKPIAARRRLGV